MTAVYSIAAIIVLTLIILVGWWLLMKITEELMARSLDRAWKKRQAKLERAKAQFNG